MKRDTVEHCCSVTVTVIGEDLHPEAVTAALMMEPDQSWRRGEQKSCALPNGKVLHFENVYKWGGWKRFRPEGERNTPLYDQVFHWLAALRDRREAINGLRERGWTVELDCFATGSEVLVLSNRELCDLAELGVDLGITLVGAEQEQGLTPLWPPFVRRE